MRTSHKKRPVSLNMTINKFVKVLQGEGDRGPKDYSLYSSQFRKKEYIQ